MTGCTVVLAEWSVMAAAYDVVVVGAGIEGSATAYYLLKRGLNVLLLEQVCIEYLINYRTPSPGHGRFCRTRLYYISMLC